MRTITEKYEALLKAKGGTQRRFRVRVDNGAGTFRDLATYLGRDFGMSVNFDENVDGNGFDAQIEIARAVELINTSPFMTTSPANTAWVAGGAVVLLVDLGREVVIEWAFEAAGVADAQLVWVEGFRGFVDDMDPAGQGNKFKFHARGQYAKILDTFIEEERIYAFADPADVDSTKGLIPFEGSRTWVLNQLVVPSELKMNGYFFKVTTAGAGGAAEPTTWSTGVGSTTNSGAAVFTAMGVTTLATGTNVETVIQQLLNDNMSAPPTLVTPVSPGWLIKWYGQERVQLWQAVRQLVDQIGLDLRYRWNGAAFELRLSDVNRAKVVPDRTFGPDERLPLRRMQKKLDGVRNVIKVWYYDTAALDSKGYPSKRSITVTDATSVTKYGRRYMEVSEASSSNIDTAAEATAFANAMLADLKEPIAECEVELPFFPFVELGDLYRMTPDGVHYDVAVDLAVVAYKHSFSSGSSPRARTTLTLRGSPSAGWRRWLVQEAGRKNGVDTHKSKTMGAGASLLTVDGAVVGGAKMFGAATLSKNSLAVGYEFHLSKTPGFTPSAATLKQSGHANEYTAGNLDSGETYYGQMLPWYFNAAKLVQGLPSVETTFTAGYLRPKHISTEEFKGETPINGSFESYSRAEGISVPPDQWEMQVGVWNTDASQVAKGGPVAKDGANYLTFINTNLATAMRSKWFPVSGDQVHSLEGWVYRNGGSNSVVLELEWVTNLKAAISTSTFSVALSTLTDSAWNFLRTVFTAPATACFARVVLRKSATSTDQFNFDAIKVRWLGEPWITFAGGAFSNSWAALKSGVAPAYRVENGRLWCKGSMAGGTVNATALTMPRAELFPVALVRCTAPDGLDAGRPIEVNTSGQLKLVAGNNTAVYLDGVSWPLS